MKRQPVKSSNILSIGYDEKSQTLEVEFKGGGLYQYAGVPEDIHKSLMKADSIGGYFYVNVRNTYKFQKVADVVISKCIINGCKNTSDQGRFVNDLCAPCYNYLKNGDRNTSQAHRNYTQIIELSKKLREEKDKNE